MPSLYYKLHRSHPLVSHANIFWTRFYKCVHPNFLHLQSNDTHNLTPPSALLTPSLNTYPAATGLTQLPPPALTPTGAFFSLSVKNTGCRFDASSSICRVCSGLLASSIGGTASIWVLGGGGVQVAGGERCFEESERVGCWFNVGGVD